MGHATLAADDKAYAEGGRTCPVVSTRRERRRRGGTVAQAKIIAAAAAAAVIAFRGRIGAVDLRDLEAGRHGRVVHRLGLAMLRVMRRPVGSLGAMHLGRGGPCGREQPGAERDETHGVHERGIRENAAHRQPR